MSAGDPGPEPGEVSASEGVLPLVEDELRISKREVVTGRVHIRTVTDATQELVRQDLHGEVVEVERVPIDAMLEPGAAAPGIRTEGEVTVIPVLEEVLIVEKRLLLKEELRVTRRGTREVAEVPVTIRRQRAVIERLGANDQPTEENAS